jgi:hypothetical protein
LVNYCVSCEHQISSDGSRSTERRESGHLSSDSRTGLFNFNLNQKNHIAMDDYIQKGKELFGKASSQ